MKLGIFRSVLALLTSVCMADVVPPTAPTNLRIAGGDPPSTSQSSVTQYGITWTFDREYPVGQFANGDYWVIGPATITDITPGWNGEKNGTMINPAVSGEHGYHARVFGYRAGLNVAAGLSTANPLTVNPTSSVISTIGWSVGDPGAPAATASMAGAPYPSLRVAAVLTVVDAAPPEGSFRPPYCGTDKPLYSTAQLQPSLLPQLPRVASMPTLASMERGIQRVWIDHKGWWTGSYIRPNENLPNYGRDLSTRFNDASLMLMVDFTPAQKRNLMIYAVQHGIDLYAVLVNSPPGAYWGDFGGGHGPGRKWPILLAGLLLGDAGMTNIGTTYGPEKFQEDCQTYLSGGVPTWGEYHCSRPGTDPGSTAYRNCCTANSWVGAVLSCRLLGAVALWNHDPLFQYQDSYMQEMPVGHWQRSWSDFAEAMWDTYR